MRVLVTGGCGFIGSHITESLSKEGAIVTVFDNLSSGYRENLAGKSDAKIVKGDILDYPKLSAACKGIDVISHQAAQLEITKALDDPLTDLRINTEGSLNVFQAALKNKIGHVIYASSAGVYGEAKTLPQSESHPTDPNWPYGVSKLAVEKYASIYSQYNRIRTTGLRYSIVYGPREWYGRVLTLFLKRALEKKPPVVWNGGQIRDFVYVTDAVNFHDRIVGSDADECRGIFNVSSNIGTSINDLARLVVSEFGLDEPIYEDIKEGEMSRQIKGRRRLPLELKKMVLDNSKARKSGWNVRVSLTDGVKKEFEWLRENPHRWERMRY